MTDLRRSRAEVRELLGERIELGEGLLSQPIAGEQDYRRIEQDKLLWHKYNEQLLGTLFTDEFPAQEYSHRGPSIGVWPQTLVELVEDLHSDIDLNLLRLRSLLNRLDLFQEESTDVSPSHESPTRGKSVFIVHGHGGREAEVALEVARLKLDWVILKDEIHGGSSTLIEKLEREAKPCGYAIVIITPDDLGRSVNDEPSDLRPRARQNVILELGFFVACLGRENVTILHDPSVEIPSDFEGVGWYPLDPGGAWKDLVERELERAGLV